MEPTGHAWKYGRLDLERKGLKETGREERGKGGIYTRVGGGAEDREEV